VPTATTPQSLYADLEEFIQRIFAFCQTDAMDTLVDLDVSFSQARTLFVLSHMGQPMPINEIASRLGLSDAAAGRNVDQLVRLGVVERTESADDRRVKLVALSKRGFEIVDQQFEQKRKALRVFADRLSPEEAENLTKALRPILAGESLRTSTKAPHDHS
jgi:DNA-binding MarR family transcriptional regulator